MMKIYKNNKPYNACERCFAKMKKGKYCSDKCRLTEIKEAWRRLQNAITDGSDKEMKNG